MVTMTVSWPVKVKDNGSGGDSDSDNAVTYDSSMVGCAQLAKTNKIVLLHNKCSR
jgi:hypothetical protein